MEIVKQIKEYIDNNSKIQQGLELVKKFTLPGFDGIPVYIVFKFILEEIKKDLLPTRARSIAYSFFIAFFPGIIFLFTLLPYIPLSEVQVQIISLINEVVPDKVVNNFMTSTIEDLINKPRGGLLSFGVIMALYFSTQGISSIIQSFNKTYSIYTKRNFFALKWVSLKLTVLLLVLFISSIILLIGGELLVQLVLDFFNIQNWFTSFVLNFLRYVIIVVLFFVSISSIYYYGPSTKRRWKFVTAGSTFATISSIIASLIFSYYISHFNNYNTVYGIFGSIIIFMTWMYLNAFVLLIGFELNAAIYYQSILLNEDDNELIA